jgi:Putative prokaryotic signal transducing protein
MKWLPILITNNDVEAEIVAAKLRDADIPVNVEKELTGSLYGVHLGSMGAVRVLVPEIYMVQAREVLDFIYIEEASEDETP